MANGSTTYDALVSAPAVDATTPSANVQFECCSGGKPDPADTNETAKQLTNSSAGGSNIGGNGSRLVALWPQLKRR